MKEIAGNQGKLLRREDFEEFLASVCSKLEVFVPFII